MEGNNNESFADTLLFHQLDDDEFDLLMYELPNGEISFHPDRLSTLVFNPFSPRFNKSLTLQNYLDPDSKLYADLCSCDFYSECTLNDKLIKIPHVNSTDLSLLYI
jgi:hypothetical protein